MGRLALSILVMIVFLSLPSSAQKTQSSEPPVSSLAGTWVINRKESKGQLLEKDAFWVIAISGSEVRIAHNFVRPNGNLVYEIALYTDQRGETNTDSSFLSLAGSPLKSTTRWNKGKLTRKFKLQPNPSVVSVTSITEEYYLSKDANKLIFNRQTMSAFTLSSQQHLPTTLVFDKKN